MDCREFERIIPDFIARRLDYPTLKRFCAHMEHCGECREELSIQFLVSEGVQRLEDGRAFDFQKELDIRLEESRKKVRFHTGVMRLGLIMEIAAVGLLAGIIVWILL